MEGIKVAMPLLMPCYKLVTHLHPVREGFAHLVMGDMYVAVKLFRTH